MIYVSPASHVPRSLAANWITVYDECLRGAPPSTSLYPQYTTFSVIDAWWWIVNDERDSLLVKSVPFVHWRIHFGAKNILASQQSFLNFDVRGKLWLEKELLNLQRKTRNRRQTEGNVAIPSSIRWWVGKDLVGNSESPFRFCVTLVWGNVLAANSYEYVSAMVHAVL
jgi:hypothetical protein